MFYHYAINYTKKRINSIEALRDKKIEEDDHRWAEEARERMNADLALLEHFYEDLDEKPSVYWTEKKAIQELYEPRIEIEVHNGGIFYLSSDSIIH